MFKKTAFVLAAAIAGSAIAQVTARPDPADPKAPAAPSTAPAPSRPAYESAFKDYRPHSDPAVTRWRESNEEMGRLKGHVGHVPGSVPPAASQAPKSGPAGHGGHK